MAREYNVKQFFQRMIAAKDRECTQCEDTIPEGCVFFKDKRGDAWCAECKSYDEERHIEREL